MTKGDTLQVKKSDGGDFPVTMDGESTCRECGCAVLWVITPKQKKMMLDHDPGEDGIYSSHWDRCKPGSGERPAAKPAPSAPKPTVDQTVINGILNRLDAIEVKLGMVSDLPFAILIAALLVL